MSIEFEHLEVCGSNHVIARNRPIPNREWLAITAGQLTDGIGATKSGLETRTWIAPVGGLYVSLIAPKSFVCKDIYLHYLPLLTGIALFHELKSILSEEDHYEKVEFKWPNDILIDDKKVCGILCERSPRVEGLHDGSFIISFGVNVVPIEFSEKIRKIEAEKNSGILKPTWLQKYLPSINAEAIKTRLIRHVVYKLMDFSQHKEQESLLRHSLNTVAIYGLNHKVKVIIDDDESKVKEGVLIAIDCREGLILENNGNEDAIVSGRIIKI